jgi:hypothetical protein
LQLNAGLFCKTKTAFMATLHFTSKAKMKESLARKKKQQQKIMPKVPLCKFP